MGKTAQRRNPALILVGVLLLHAALVQLLLRHDYDSAPDDDGVPMRYMNAMMIQPVARQHATVIAQPAEPDAVAPTSPRRPLLATRQVTQANTVAVASASAPHASPPAPGHLAAENQPPPKVMGIDQMRQLARDDERSRAKTPQERLRAQELASESRSAVTTRAIARAKRDDCRTAYSGGPVFDPLRLIPLAIDTLTDTGCKW